VAVIRLLANMLRMNLITWAQLILYVLIAGHVALILMLSNKLKTHGINGYDFNIYFICLLRFYGWGMGRYVLE